MTTEISSPSFSGYPLSLCLTKSQNSLSTVILLLPNGIKVTLFACLQSIFFTFRRSLSPAPAFFLVWPSILIMSVSFSSSSAGQAVTAVLRFPEISMTSPARIPRYSIWRGSILARLLPTSRCLASATLSWMGDDSSLPARIFFNPQEPPLLISDIILLYSYRLPADIRYFYLSYAFDTFDSFFKLVHLSLGVIQQKVADNGFQPKGNWLH